ncbi:hypothetical protein OH76DRAFT_891201 [Lentinus brumalis]|uniref:Fungal-type protein kinase domain-containing protein n=1 Tax=Lentinus brumalis TaxID=2498619 RepID=A0A371D121_9APHY|nr:hypothetical protein OH76DRAFT_891201 [Polyporus brumalis]
MLVSVSCLLGPRVSGGRFQSASAPTIVLPNFHHLQSKMSFSSSSVHSSSACSSTDVDSTGASVQSGWASELDGRILLSDLPLEDYLDELVPCSSPYESANLTIDANTFSDYEPGDGLEVKSTPHVRNGLASLVADFDDDIRLSFWDSHSGDYRFPLSPFATNHAKSSPDISVSFPGASDDVEARSSRWEIISMCVEAKDTEKGDPFPHHKSGATNADTIVQLARNARTLMLVHGFLYSFVLGIYGDIVRIARFDRTVCIVSRPFNLRHNLHILQRFFWHYTHPIIGSPVVGCDPTIRPLTTKEDAWLQKHLTRARVERTEMDIFMTRRVEVHDDHEGTVVPYFVYQVVDVNPRLMSRSTIVWRAIKDTYAEDQHARNAVKSCILKESWRHLVRRPEAVFYRRMASTIPEEERWGLPRLLAGGDIGQLELRAWELCSPHAVDLAYERHLRLPMSPFPAASTYRYPPSCPLPWPQHQTVTWAINMTSKCTYRERSHMRFVIEEVGRPLTDFRDTKELVTAMRDAIKGHRLAYNKAGILHRDVNLGNILIVDEPTPEGPLGFLHDFDYSYMTDVAPGHDSAPASSNIDSTELKEKTVRQSCQLHAIAIIDSDARARDISCLARS